ncbi:GNAT family N-acetyltransferase [Streptomyces cocklensis]|uniref:Acetyltransferase (GNAT) family protein n=1 Tax=Actinacidiphila cocklensis TaxID=887465 RepID=A0A9W4GTH9_9ACTN|nr:GNAT family N-acetyltransferase [Actinacidiphila cocklensis]MDD1061472.1 GNAT family N-acetyltransferase [Actinacidiphila cocklensis]WSX77540.1 GNAT family N-acetyltransferase [Streptomyces sp. NBC_00899]CAG6396534.1 Acetyltransferase (GNAT) family protein [Actinacidiphila cocklensis]
MRPTETAHAPAVGGEIVIRVHAVSQSQPLVDTLADVWASAHPELAAGGEDGRVHGVESLRQQINGHFRHAGFTLAVAYEAGTLVGFGYGFPCTAEYWYGEELLPDIPAEAREDLMGLCELAVRPGWQSRGIGTRLHERLVQAVAPRWTSLLVSPANSRGRTLYERLGYRYAGPYRNGDDTYDLLIARAG